MWTTEGKKTGKNRTLWTCGTIAKDLNFGFSKEEKESGERAEKNSKK